VDSVEALRRFPYTGHGSLMGTRSIPWQETREALASTSLKFPAVADEI
jgi:hypothetical protein